MGSQDVQAAYPTYVIELAEAEAQAARLLEALRVANAAIWEFHRYMYGGELRGSYNGDSERKGLWAAGNLARATLAKVEGAQ